MTLQSHPQRNQSWNLVNLISKMPPRQAAGNWKTFESFAWHRRQDVPDPDNWTIIYTHHRDSTLLDQSNAEAIEEAMERSRRGQSRCRVRTSSPWACGWIDGYIRVEVYRRGKITKAFRAYHKLAQRLADYPCWR